LSIEGVLAPEAYDREIGVFKNETVAILTSVLSIILDKIV
jgi:hypothetical protein